MILRWLPRAIRDRDAQIDHIVDHIAERNPLAAIDQGDKDDQVSSQTTKATPRNPLAAIDQGDKIEHQVGQLLEHPDIGRPGRTEGTRELVISGTPFIIVYRHKPRSKRIELIRLLHGAQEWPSLEK